MQPEQVKVALTLADGTLAIMSVVTRSFHADGSVHFERDVSEESVRAECAKAALELVSWRRVEPADLPSTRQFRGAWVDPGAGPVDVDLPRARELHRAQLRAARAPLLAALDVDYQRADERGDAAGKGRVAAAKQALRDVTNDPRIDAATTPAELAAVVLPALDGQGVSIE